MRGAKHPKIPPTRKRGPGSLREVCQHSRKELLIAKCGGSPSFPSPSPAPGVWRGAISSARSPEGEGRRGPGILWAAVPVGREEPVGGLRGWSLGHGGGGGFSLRWTFALHTSTKDEASHRFCGLLLAHSEKDLSCSVRISGGSSWTGAFHQVSRKKYPPFSDICQKITWRHTKDTVT